MEPAHGGDAVVEVVRRYGVETMFTLSGGHVFPLYDGAVRAGRPRILDVRHEQTAPPPALAPRRERDRRSSAGDRRRRRGLRR